MQLYELKVGKSKSKMKAVMIDKISAVNVYLTSLGGSGRSGRIRDQWFEVVPAQPGAVPWSKKSASVTGGYIGKNGFNPHT